MNDAVLSFLGLMKRAGAICFTQDSCREALREGKSVAILLAADASPAVVERFNRNCKLKDISCTVVNYSKTDFARALGLSDCAVISINDTGFYDALLKKL